MNANRRSFFARLLENGNRPITSVTKRLGDLSRVMNYTRGLLEFSVRPDDVFIVTYPRSGTTLMQYMLYQLTTEESSLDFEHISQVAPWFERSLAVGALEAADLERLESPRIFKSHLAYLWIPKGARYIYVTRDGKDVAMSYYHFYRSHLRYSGSFAAFFERFLRGDVQYRSWFKHTAGWHAQRGDPSILFLRFEDLVHSLRSCVDQVAEFLGITVSNERLEEVSERCSFAAMKQNEEKFDFATELLLERGLRSCSFLRGGRTGDGDTIRPEQQQAFDRLARSRRRFARIELDLPAFLH